MIRTKKTLTKNAYRSTNMATLTIVNGPYTSPVGEGYKVIIVPCNVLGISDMPHLKEVLDKYPDMKQDYAFDKSYASALGYVGLMHESASHICDFYVMDRLSPDLVGNPLIHSDAFDECAQSLYSIKMASGEYSVHYPLIRKDENGEEIREILTEVFVENGISVYAYDNEY